MMYNACDPSIGVPPPGAPTMTLMDMIESDELGDLDVEFLNNEVRNIKCTDFGKGYCEDRQYCKNDHRYKPGVYTFCHKFQYSTCTAPQCKYVHASPYEQQVYYRTGKFLSYGLQHLNNQVTSLNGMSSSFSQLSRNQFPKRLLPEVPWLPVTSPGRAVPMMDVADIPLPGTPSVLPSSLPRATKRRWLAMEAADNSSGGSIKRCASCDIQME